MQCSAHPVLIYIFFLAIMDKAREDFPQVSALFTNAFDESRAKYVLLFKPTVKFVPNKLGCFSTQTAGN